MKILGGMRAVFLLVAAGTMLAQAPSPNQNDQPDFRVEAFSTLYEVRVLDGDGNVVRNLQEQDFQVREDGRDRPLIFFRERADYPVALAILVDTGSNMSERAIGTAKQVILDLVHRLDPEDQILLASYRDEVHYLSPLTRDRLELLEGVRNLSATGRKSGLARLGNLFASDAWTGSAIDEVLLSLKKYRADEKILLVFSAGFGNVGVGTLDHLRMAGARFISVSVNNRLGDAFNLGGDQAAKRRILRGTGGVNFDADEILERVEQLRSVIKHHYLLAYQPLDPEKPDGFEVKISVARHPEYSVHFARRTRSGSAFY